MKRIAKVNLVTGTQDSSTFIYKKKQNSEDASDVSAEDEDSIIVWEGAEHE